MLVAENIVKSFAGPSGGPRALDGVSLEARQGEFLCIVGRSGSGKSTLLNVLSTLLRPDAGDVRYQGRSLAGLSDREIDRLRSTDFSMIFQMHHLLPYLSALENVMTPFMKSFRRVTRAQREKALECLEKVGLADKAGRLPGELSGGEQQRTAIARALAVSPKILFADEPTGSLDKATGETVMGLIAKLNAEGLTVIMVSHDPDYAARASRRIVLTDGRTVSDG